MKVIRRAGSIWFDEHGRLELSEFCDWFNKAMTELEYQPWDEAVAVILPDCTGPSGYSIHLEGLPRPGYVREVKSSIKRAEEHIRLSRLELEELGETTDGSAL